MLTPDQLADLRTRCMDLSRTTAGRPVKLYGGPLAGFTARLRTNTFSWGLATLADAGCIVAEYEDDGIGLRWRGYYRAGGAIEQGG